MDKGPCRPLTWILFSLLNLYLADHVLLSPYEGGTASTLFLGERPGQPNANWRGWQNQGLRLHLGTLAPVP